MPDPTIVISSLVDDPSEEAVRRAVTSRQPDGDVHQNDIAWWLALQERIEIRAELTAGLLLSNSSEREARQRRRDADAERGRHQA